MFRVPNYDSESSVEDDSRDNSLEITNVCKRPAYSILSSIDDSDSDDFEDQDLNDDLINGVDEPSRDRALDNPTTHTIGTAKEYPIAIVDAQDSVQASKLHVSPGSSQTYPIDVEDAERESDVAEDDNASEEDEGPEILPFGQSNRLPSLPNPSPPDASFTPVNSANYNGSQCTQSRPKVDSSRSAQEPVQWPAFATEHSKYGQNCASKAPEPSLHYWSYPMTGAHDLPLPNPSRYEEGPFSSTYENRFIPEVLRRPSDFGEREQLQYNFHPITHQYTNQSAATSMENRPPENPGFHGKSKFETTGPSTSTAIENVDVSAPRARSNASIAHGDFVLHGNVSSWKYPSYADRAWTPDETDNPKGSNLKISDLVHSYTDSTRCLKRKASEISSSIEARVPTPSPDSTELDTDDSTVLHSAQAQHPPTDMLISSSRNSSMEVSHNTPLEREDLVPDVIEGPATKKTKCSSKTTTRSGKFVSGFLIGVAGTIAATTAALISSASADVWQEALHEATHSI